MKVLFYKLCERNVWRRESKKRLQRRKRNKQNVTNIYFPISVLGVCGIQCWDNREYHGIYKDTHE
jgi:hypothetical protein